MTECDPREMIRQTVEMVERFFADPDVSFDEQKIQDFLKSRKDDIPAFSSALDRDGCGGDCSMTETDTARLRDAYVLCIDRNWKLCIAKLLVTLSTGQFATVDLLNQIWMYDNAGTSILHTPIPGSAPLPAVIRDAVFKHQYGDATAKKEAYAQLYDYAAKIKRPKTIEDARALYTLGRWLYFGEGCKQSRTEGLALIERACADDTLILRDAHLFLARFYRDEADPQKAKAHLQTAANAGSFSVCGATASFSSCGTAPSFSVCGTAGASSGCATAGSSSGCGITGVGALSVCGTAGVPSVCKMSGLLSVCMVRFYSSLSASGTAVRWISFFRRLKNTSRSSITIRPQPWHLILISAPVRMTTQVLPPQG